MVRQFVLALLVMIAASATAQKLQTVDKDGQPVPYVSVISEDGDIIGTTGLDGVLDNLKGAEVVSVTHVAYKSKKVKVGQGGRVVLEDADFDLPEIAVTNKPLVYVQTYYRVIYLNDDPNDKLCYYRAGLLNNSFDRKTKKLSVDEDHLSASSSGIFKTALNLIIGAYIKQIAGLKMVKVESRMKRKYQELGITFLPEGPGRQLINDNYGIVGVITDNQANSERRYSYDTHLLRKHQIQTTGSEKKKAKAEKKEAQQKNRTDQDFTVYHIDDQGNYFPEDLVMHQLATSYDEGEKGDKHVNILFQVFTTDRACVTKDELKQTKKANKMKMTYQNIQEFERVNNIHPLPEELSARLKEIVK